MESSAQLPDNSFLNTIFSSFLESNQANNLIVNEHLVFISIVGGIVLFLIKLAEHWRRDEKDKLSKCRYFGYILYLVFCLPTLGGMVAVIYILNGDKISPLLAFQVGLTSPAIAQSLMMSAANSAQKIPIKTQAGA